MVPKGGLLTPHLDLEMSLVLRAKADAVTIGHAQHHMIQYIIATVVLRILNFLVLKGC